MKLFQAFVIVIAIFLIDFSKDTPAQRQVTQWPATAHLSTPGSQPADSLQKQFERAVWNNDIQTLKTIITSGIDINRIHREDGYAALHWAVERRLTETVVLLLSNGADIDIFTHNAIGPDRTALHIAAELGYFDIARILLEHGANLNKKTVYGESPLHGVRMFIKEPKVVEVFIEFGADVNAVTSFGITPLHSASLLGVADIADVLINNGARVDLADKRGLTPLHYAAQQGHVDIVNKLIAADVHLDAQTRTGDTAMHLAAKKGHSEVVRILLDQGANPLTLNHFSKSPLSEAKERAYDHLVEMLSSILPAETGG